MTSSSSFDKTLSPVTSPTILTPVTETKSWFMPEVESIYGGDDTEDYLSEDDDDDGVGFGMLGGKFRLAGPGSSSVRRLSCRLKKSFSTPSFKSFLDNNVAAASLLLSPPPAQQPRLPTYPNKFEAVQDVNEDDEDDEEDSDDNIFHH